MPRNYGHDIHGVNIKNLKALESTCRQQPGGYRSQVDWKREVDAAAQLADKHKQSSTHHRNTGKNLQDSMAQLTISRINNVNQAIESKLSKSEALKSALSQCLEETNQEMDVVLKTRNKIDRLIQKNAQLLALNERRQRVRADRPNRELVNDVVHGQLVSQENALQGQLAGLQRSLAGNERQYGLLTACRECLAEDLADKIESIECDTKVLNVPDNLSECSEATPIGRRGGQPPYQWQRRTEKNCQAAQFQVLSSMRLRAAVGKMVQERKQVSKQMTSQLNTGMQNKLYETREAKMVLQQRLQQVKSEIAQALSRRAELIAGLNAKNKPLNQATKRFEIRGTKPQREQVMDEVDSALLQEIADLQCSQTALQDKIRSLDNELSNLSSTALLLEQNILDKSRAAMLEEQCAKLDGRSVASQPPSEVSTSLSLASTSRSFTLSRIQKLESELNAARKEREEMEGMLSRLQNGTSNVAMVACLQPEIYSDNK